MKTIMLSISNSLMELSIIHSLHHSGGFIVLSVASGSRGIAEKCAAGSADILLMEAAFHVGATLADCLKEAKSLRCTCPDCKVILLCDENSAPDVARKVVQAKKDGLIDDFVYSSVSEIYLTAMLYAI